MSLEVIDDAGTEMPSSNPATEPAITPESVTPAATVGEPAVAAPATPVSAAPAVPAFTPNFKYSVKGQEKEIDEMFRALVKDAESEKKIKEIFERADGLDVVKQDRTALKQEFEGFKTQITPYMQEYHKFTSLRDKGNLGAAFQVAGINDEDIFKYALQKLQMSENPHMADLYKNNTEATLREFDMSGQLQQVQLERQQLQAQQFDFNLNQAINSHKDVVSAIEAKWGQPGSFMEEVKAFGLSQYHMGKNLTEPQAVEAVLNKYKPFLGSAPQAPVNQPAHQAPAVIPNAGNTNISPVMHKPRTVDDLKKLANEAG